MLINYFVRWRTLFQEKMSFGRVNRGLRGSRLRLISFRYERFDRKLGTVYHVDQDQVIRDPVQHNFVTDKLWDGSSLYNIYILPAFFFAFFFRIFHIFYSHIHLVKSIF